MSKLLQIAIAFDQLGNALLGGWADETISARAWRQRHKRRWRIVMRVLDKVFGWLGDADHCRKAHEAELQRRQSPESTRAGTIASPWRKQ